MAYTVTWEQLPFTDYTWSSVQKLVPKAVACMFIKTRWDFILKDGDDIVRVERYPPRYIFSMRPANAFAKDLIKTLIIMVEFGGAKIMKGNEPDMSIYLDALEEVQSIYNLISYDQQKSYFLSVKE